MTFEQSHLTVNSLCSMRTWLETVLDENESLPPMGTHVQGILQMPDFRLLGKIIQCRTDCLKCVYTL